MERLSKNKIKSIEQRNFDGVPYLYTITTKLNRDIIYGNIEKNGKFKTDYYNFNWLPKCAQNFIREKFNDKKCFYNEELIELPDGEYTLGIYTYE